jgi:hypothetical protein
VSSVAAQLTYRVRQNNDQPPFQNGTLSKTVAQRLAGGIGNLNPTATGQIAFRLANSWNYTAGLYTQTIVFTLSAP